MLTSIHSLISAFIRLISDIMHWLQLNISAYFNTFTMIYMYNISICHQSQYHRKKSVFQPRQHNPGLKNVTWSMISHNRICSDKQIKGAQYTFKRQVPLNCMNWTRRCHCNVISVLIACHGFLLCVAFCEQSFKIQ